MDGPIVPAIKPPHLTRDLPEASWKISEEKVESNKSDLKKPLIFKQLPWMKRIPAGSAWMFMAAWHFPLQKLPGHAVPSPFLCRGAAPTSHWAQPNLPAFRQPRAKPAFPPTAGTVPESRSPSRVRLAGLGTLAVEALLCSSPQQPAQALGDAHAARLPSLPAQGVTKLQGKRPGMISVYFLSPVISREGSQHTVGAGACSCCRHFAAQRRGWYEMWFSRACKNTYKYRRSGF